MTLPSKLTKRVLCAASVLIAASVFAIGQSSGARGEIHPEVHLDANGLAPRPIEDLTGTSIVRYYAAAWQNMAVALDSGRTSKLSDAFVGFAKDRLMKRIADQNQTGVHVRIIDHGHQLKALFYSTDGASMQLLDRAQLEIQTFDGSKLLDSQSTPREYLVLMTPGADRWYVRDMQEVSPNVIAGTR